MVCKKKLILFVRLFGSEYIEYLGYVLRSRYFHSKYLSCDSQSVAVYHLYSHASMTFAFLADSAPSSTDLMLYPEHLPTVGHYERSGASIVTKRNNNNMSDVVLLMKRMMDFRGFS